jgi:hypothetical protein
MASLPKSEEQKLAKRVKSARENGSLGGLKTAQNHSQEWLDERARKGGKALVERYSTDYYRWINSQRRRRRGWPLGKLRKALPTVTESLEQACKKGQLSVDVTRALETMLQSSTS